MQIKHENTSVNAESTIDGQPIEAGIIKGLFKKLSNIFDKLLDKIDRDSKLNNTIDNLGTIGTRNKEFEVAFLCSDVTSENSGTKQISDSIGNNWPKDRTLLVKVKFKPGTEGTSDILDVYVKRADQEDSQGIAARDQELQYTDPTDEEKCKEELFSYVLGVADSVWLDFFPENTECLMYEQIAASVKVTLKKVMADDEVDIELVSVNTPFAPDRTLEVLNNLTENADFVEALPMNEPASYVVDPEDMSFLACAEEECCDISCSIFKILGSLYQLYFDSMYVVWNAKGSNYTSIVSFADSYVWAAKGLIDQLSAYHYQLFNYAPHPATFLNACNSDACMSAPNDIVILQKDLDDIVSNIDLYYCNFEGTLQECLMQAKDMFEKESNYSLARFNG